MKLRNNYFVLSLEFLADLVALGNLSLLEQLYLDHGRLRDMLLAVRDERIP